MYSITRKRTWNIGISKYKSIGIRNMRVLEHKSIGVRDIGISEFTETYRGMISYLFLIGK